MAESKRLLLMRHAKSSWNDPALADHDRPLAPRGRKAAKRIGAYLGDERIQLVLCSSARRATETQELVSPPGEVRIEEELYGATADRLLERLQSVPDVIDTAMLIGHNPAIQDLAVSLSGGAAELLEKFPTGAVATLAWNGSWRALAAGQAELTAFVKPRELGPA
jgi:phosphohistidine phosphatase